MEIQEELIAHSEYSNGCSDSVCCGNGLERTHTENGVVDEDEKGEILGLVSEGLEEYSEDVTDRIMVSRMVTSVEHGPTERIAAKEFEGTDLKKYIQCGEVGTGNSDRRFTCIGDVCWKREKMREDLTAWRKLTREQLKKANKEVGHAGGANSVKKMLEGLNTTLDAFCTEVDGILVSSEISLSLCESQGDHDVLVNLEDIVMQSVIKSLQEEHNAYVLHGIQTVNWHEKFIGISDLGTQLKEIQKLLCIHETGLVSHGSHNLDRLHHKAFDNHTDENVTVDESNVHVAERYDFQHLQHLTKEHLAGYFNDIISKLKRDHESVLHKKTEELFRLKREFLKERGPHRKYEEFDALRKKIPQIISKLEGFLSENERFPALTNFFESVGKSKISLDNLLFENRQLRDSLNDKKNEVKCLEARVSGAAEALSQSSLAEEDLLNLVVNLKSSVEDSCIEASVSEEVYKSALREQISQTWCASSDSNMEIRKCLENTALEKENELRLEVEENKKLKQDIQDLRTALEQKKRLAMDLSLSLSKESEKFEVTSRELSSLREHSSQLQMLVIEGKLDLEVLRSQNSEALDQIEVDKMELLKVEQKLDQTKVVLSEANKEKHRALVVSQEMHGKLLLSEARVDALKKEMGLAVSGLSDFFDDFECRISEAVRKNSIRFENTSSHLKSLNKVASDLRRREQTYKQNLGFKSVNLRKAESEVDLLGDEVESLLRLLRKIYITLDHYSPVLKHYPGIIDILELVKRELSGTSTVLL